MQALATEYKKIVGNYLVPVTTYSSPYGGLIYFQANWLQPKRSLPRLHFQEASMSPGLSHNYQIDKWRSLGIADVYLDRHKVGQINQRPHRQFRVSSKPDKGALRLGYNTLIDVLNNFNFKVIK